MTTSILLTLSWLAFGGGNLAPDMQNSSRSGPATAAPLGVAAPLQGSGCAPVMACVALAVYTESRGEPLLGQIAVAGVIRRRVYDRQMTPCEVVTEPNQFDGITRYKNTKPWNTDPKGWAIAMMVAEMTFDYGAVIPQCASADHFYTSAVDTDWSRRQTVVCRIGGHLFTKN